MQKLMDRVQDPVASGGGGGKLNDRAMSMTQKSVQFQQRTQAIIGKWDDSSKTNGSLRRRPKDLTTPAAGSATASVAAVAAPSMGPTAVVATAAASSMDDVQQKIDSLTNRARQLAVMQRNPTTRASLNNAQEAVSTLQAMQQQQSLQNVLGQLRGAADGLKPVTDSVDKMTSMMSSLTQFNQTGQLMHQQQQQQQHQPFSTLLTTESLEWHQRAYIRGCWSEANQTQLLWLSARDPTMGMFTPSSTAGTTNAAAGAAASGAVAASSAATTATPSLSSALKRLSNGPASQLLQTLPVEAVRLLISADQSRLIVASNRLRVDSQSSSQLWEPIVMAFSLSSDTKSTTEGTNTWSPDSTWQGMSTVLGLSRVMDPDSSSTTSSVSVRVGDVTQNPSDGSYYVVLNTGGNVQPFSSDTNSSSSSSTTPKTPASMLIVRLNSDGSMATSPSFNTTALMTEYASKSSIEGLRILFNVVYDQLVVAIRRPDQSSSLALLDPLSGAIIGNILDFASSVMLDMTFSTDYSSVVAVGYQISSWLSMTPAAFVSQARFTKSHDGSPTTELSPAGMLTFDNSIATSIASLSNNRGFVTSGHEFASSSDQGFSPFSALSSVVVWNMDAGLTSDTVVKTTLTSSSVPQSASIRSIQVTSDQIAWMTGQIRGSLPASIGETVLWSIDLTSSAVQQFRLPNLVPYQSSYGSMMTIDEDNNTIYTVGMMQTNRHSPQPHAFLTRTPLSLDS